jgi:hypothetical protein
MRHQGTTRLHNRKAVGPALFSSSIIRNFLQRT